MNKYERTMREERWMLTAELFAPERPEPPEVDEIPECCDEVMTVDDQGNCLCDTCGKTIPRPPDIEPIDDYEQEKPLPEPGGD